MLIYQDIITGDELFSDAFDVKEVDGSYQIDCAMIQVKQGADVDIGANASAEEAGEDLEDGVEIVNNVVYSFRLQSTSFDKKGFTVYVKGYLKALKAHVAAQAEKDGKDVEAATKAFESEITPEVKKILGSFKDYEFYVGESMNPDGGLLFLNYREDGVTPFFTVFKAAVKTMKV
ncbi:Ribosome associating protein [Podila minutissima]|uniref:Translationally-controlled tumor protein homolog n=1 Tax=Podila minutissima TaxID=64525 RepID=A0A9P5SP21_9FUNG|nr:Ribosome associating protein [Podila minutissima]